VEFLVHIEFTRPESLAEETWLSTRAAERLRFGELFSSGKVRRVWRLPGRRAGLALFDVADGSELEKLISSLPAFPYLNVRRVEALANHPLDTEFGPPR
jgi:muconolactone D-isomerase